MFYRLYFCSRFASAAHLALVVRLILHYVIGNADDIIQRRSTLSEWSLSWLSDCVTVITSSCHHLPASYCSGSFPHCFLCVLFIGDCVCDSESGHWLAPEELDLS